jgi:uncharacterized membrane protein YcaP (DUF421 family)
MQSFEIHLDDWMRILVGNVPLSFFIEVVFRVVFIFLLIIFCMRLMGKRMAAQLHRNELLALSALAASIGIPIQSPDRGLLPAVIVATIVVLAQRFIALVSTRSERFESRSQGDICELVSDGVMNPRNMMQTRISQERLFAQLRSMHITHLGKVSRLYFEANGSFTLIDQTSPAPGLSVLPDKDPEFRSRQRLRHDLRVCENCGQYPPCPQYQGRCTNCGHDVFVAPVET